MASKQIKELLIKLSSVGAKEVTGEVKSLQEALSGAVTVSAKLDSSLKSSAKYMGQTSLAFANANKAIEASTASIRKLNNAINGETQKAVKGLNAYVENIQILDIYLKDISVSAVKAAAALGSVGAVGGMEKLIDLMEELITSVGTVDASLESLGKTLKEIETNTGKTSARLKQTRDAVTDVEVQTNRTNEALGDLANSGLGKVETKVKDTTKKTDLFNNSLRRLNSVGSSSSRAFSSLAFGMNPLVATYAAIAVNVYALTEAFRILKEAAALERLEQQAAGFASAMTGVNVKELAVELQNASAGALSFSDAMNTAVRGISFDFTTQQLVELTDGARKASIALGRDFNDSMDRVIRGISKMEVELLDELGVVTRLETAFANYVAKAGVAGLTVNKLTDAQRRLALTQEVNYQLQLRYGKSIDKQITGWEALGVAAKDLSNTLLKGTAGALESTATKLAELLRLMTPVQSSAMAAAESQKIFNKAIEDANYGQAIVALSEYSSKIVEFDETAKTTSDALAKQQEAIEAVANALALLASVFVTTKLIGLVTGLTTVVARGVTLFYGAAKAAAVLRAALFALSGPIGWILGATTVVAGGFLVAETYEATSEAVSDLTREMSGYNEVLEKNNKLREQARTGTEFYKSEINKVVIELQKLKNAGLNVPGADINTTYLNGLDENALKGILSGLQKQLGDFGSSQVAFERGIADSMNRVGKSYADLGRQSTSIDQIADSFSALNETAKTIYMTDEALGRILSKDWTNLQMIGLIPKDLQLTAENLDLVTKKLEKLQNTEIAVERDRSKVLLQVSAANSATGNIQILEQELSLIRQQISARQEAIKGAAGANYVYDLKTEQMVLAAKLEQAKTDREILLTGRAREVSLAAQQANLTLIGANQSKVLEAEKALLESEAKLLELKDRDAEALRQRLALLDIEIAKQKELEAAQMRMTQLTIQETNLQRSIDRAGSATEQARLLSEQLAIKAKMIQQNKQLSESERAIALNDLGNQSKDVAGMTSSAGAMDFSQIAGNMAGLEGLTNLQSTFASSLSGLSNTYGNFLKDMESQGMSFSDYLSGNIDALSNVLSSSLSLAQAAFAEISQSKIDSIDREIEAEKRRDGKSEESLARIKKLQAQKIKEEAKAKKASVGMSTATAIMQAMAQIPYPVNIAMAAAVGAMGMMQMANVDKAANGQLAALNGGSGNLSVSAGSRSNEIDVSKQVNAGELAYLRGQQGTGTANNFIPGKAVGGYTPAGTGIVVGESGPEVITPAVPSVVTPAGQASGTVQIQFSPVFNTNTIDSAGFDQLTERYSRELYNGLERELRARNRSLENL